MFDRGPGAVLKTTVQQSEVKRALILHGDDDQIVPIADFTFLSAKVVKGATLKVIPGAPHGMCSMLRDQVNSELLAFFKGKEAAASA